MVWWYTHVQLLQSCLTAWTVAHQAPLSMGFSRQEYWSGVLLPTPHGVLGRWKEKTDLEHTNITAACHMRVRGGARPSDPNP